MKLSRKKAQEAHKEYVRRLYLPCFSTLCLLCVARFSSLCFLCLFVAQVLCGLAREQVGFDEVVDVSTKHGVNISSFQFGPCVLH
jgi:hypothetical protein